jgi:hypothetical protein
MTIDEVKLACLKLAVERAASGSKPEDVVETAKIFEKYVQDGARIKNNKSSSA